MRWRESDVSRVLTGSLDQIDVHSSLALCTQNELKGIMKYLGENYSMGVGLFPRNTI